MIHLAANENPLGMPPAARAALAGADFGPYPDGPGTALRQAIGARLGVPADWTVLGSGSSEILELAAGACVQPGQSVVLSQYAFVVYGQAAAHAHARAIVVPARDFGHDLEAMAAAIGSNTALVFVANPNNPTGHLLDAQRLLAFLTSVPPSVVVVLDEAYTEYLTPEQRYDAIAWVRRLPNLVVARTFSKAYGLAGLRIGYAVAQSALAARLHARRPRFNVGTAAQLAARAAWDDGDFLARSHALNLAGRARLQEGLAALGLRCLPSAGNFVAVEVGPAAAIHAALLAAGIEVSRLDAYGLPRWLRISVGLPEHNEAVLAALAGALPPAGRR